MSHLTLAQQGIAAVEQRDYDTAITKLTSALQISLNPSWLIQRSKALNGAGFHTASLADADLAWHAALSRNRRELIAEANYRRAVACNRLGRFADAATCAAYAMRIFKEDGPLLAKEDPKEAWVDAQGRCTLKLDEVKAATKADRFNQPPQGAKSDPLVSAGFVSSSEKVKAWRIASVLQIQALVAMEKLDEDDEARVVTVSQKPEKQGLSNPKTAGSDAAPAEPAAPPTPSAAPAAAPKPATLRLDNYQSDTQLTVSLFSKGVDKSRLKVEFLPFAVNLDPVVFPGGEEKSYTLDLWGEIDTENSTHRVTPSKIELVLKKKTTGKWVQVVKDETEAGPSGQSTEQTTIKKTAPAVPVKAQDSQPTPETKLTASEATDKEGQSGAGLSYPTSSRSGPKNWDKLEGGDSDDESDVNQFFKKIYKGATPEQQRAMMKSFTESNGTSLSTDWDDVKGRTVETMPPEGVEAKKWT